MKTAYLFLLLLVTPMLFAQSDHYYYSFDERIDLTLDKRFLNISTDAEFRETDLESFDFKPFTLQVETTKVNGVSRQWGRLEFNENPTDAAYYTAIEALKNVEGIETVTPGYLTPDGVELLTSAYLYVKLNDAGGYAQLEELAGQYEVDIINQNQFMPLWYTLRSNKNTTDHPLAIANQFYETGWFAAAQPDLFENRSPIQGTTTLSTYKTTPTIEETDFIAPCASGDPLTFHQWAYYSPTFFDFGINMCDAWYITEGDSDIIVAVLDHGFKKDSHPDINNIFPLSYDTEQDSVYVHPHSAPIGANKNHGVPVAGIIGATKDNQIGIAGVAPGCTLMDVTNSLESTTNSQNARADGINWAWQNGADIINNSWAINTIAGHAMINDAIDNAVTYGRNGKGTILVCASGNYLPTWNQNVLYPASHNQTLAVGATSSCGWRVQIDPIAGCPSSHWGSNYNHSGASNWLDVVAPGFSVATTDRVGSNGYVPGDYILDFSGTSAAAPFVAGVAALMLSANPCLRHEQVKEIIKATANRQVYENLDMYSFSSTSTPSLRFKYNDEIGYGLINAGEAVRVASEIPSTADLYIRNTWADIGAEPDNISHLHLFNTPNIAVRLFQGQSFNHQNPRYEISQTTGNQRPNYVYVRVYNRGCTASIGDEELKLYWSKASSATTWPDYWNGSVTNPLMGDIIGTQTIPVIEPGENAVLEFEWYPPNPDDYSNIGFEAELLWPFSLLARIDSSNDPMTFPETAHTWTNVKNNNNIVMKNVTVVCLSQPCDPGGSGPGGIVAIGNPYEATESYDFKFQSFNHTSASKLHENAEVIIELDEPAWEKWLEGGQEAENLEVFSDDERKLIVTGSSARLKNMTFDSREFNFLYASFYFLIDEVEEQEEFEFTVEQIGFDVEGEYVVGGHLYHIIRDAERPHFEVEGTADQSAGAGNPVFLYASPINEPAVYNWYDAEGTLLYSGTDFAISPEITQTYRLEVIADADFHKGYTDVIIEVQPQADHIESLTPNPASATVCVKYDISNAGSAYIKIIQPFGNISGNYILDLTDDSINIGLTAYPTGLYTVILVVDGQAVHAKHLIVQ